MTESEFQECIITLGYRYNQKTRTAFNSFEGFHALLKFAEKEGRYTLRLECCAKSVDDAASVADSLKAFREENREYVSKAKYKRKYISVEIKKTVDSEIDREELKSLVHFITEICKSDHLKPLCRVCARERKTGVYVIGKEVVPVCDSCAVRKRRLFEKRLELFETKKQSWIGGIIGAFFGASLRGAIYVFIYQFINLYGISAVAIPLLCFFGFVAVGQRATKISGIICAVISILIFMLSEYISMVVQMAVGIERDDGGIEVARSIEYINVSLQDSDTLMSYMPEVLIGVGAILLTGFVYFLKRKFTRPMRISKNIL